MFDIKKDPISAKQPKVSQDFQEAIKILYHNNLQEQFVDSELSSFLTQLLKYHMLVLENKKSDATEYLEKASKELDYFRESLSF